MTITTKVSRLLCVVSQALSGGFSVSVLPRLSLTHENRLSDYKENHGIVLVNV